MIQVFAPFQIHECFEVDGVDYLVLDYNIVYDHNNKIVEWASQYQFKRLRDHKHFIQPFTKIYDAHKNGKAKASRIKL